MIRINLLPVRVSKKKEAGKQQLILFALLIVAGLVVNYAWAAQRAGVLKGIRAGIEKERQDIAGLERIIGEVKNIRAQQDQLKQKLDVLDKLKAGRIGPVKMLDELATVTPKRLWLKRFEEKGGATITFEGTAATIDDVSAFMAALRSSTHFGNVELKKTAATAQRGAPIRLVDFTITTTVTYGGLVAQAPAPGAGPAGAPPAPPR